MTVRPYRHLCPEADLRDAMPDEEFWAHVLGQDDDLDQLDAEPLDIAIAQDACGECGSIGACAWDAEGLPLIHSTTHDREDGLP